MDTSLSIKQIARKVIKPLRPAQSTTRPDAPDKKSFMEMSFRSLSKFLRS